MRRGLKFKWRDAAIVGVGLTVFFGLVLFFDYRVGGIDKFEISLQRLVRGSTVDPDLSLEEIESRLADHLTNPDIFPGPRSATSFTIDGCIATYRGEAPRAICENRSDVSWWKMEKFFDLRLLETTPWSVDSREMRPGLAGGNTHVTWKFRSEAAKRLLYLYRASESIRRSGMARYPSDVSERLVVINRNLQEKLQDRLFETNGIRRSYCNGLETLAPEWRGEVRFFVRTQNMIETVDLMHAYASWACPFDPPALE